MSRFVDPPEGLELLDWEGLLDWEEQVANLVQAVARPWAERGAPAFPVAISADDGKLRKRPLTERGHLSASTDLAELHGMFKGAAARLRDDEVLGVGIRPGPAGLVVVDVDGPGNVALWQAAEHGSTYTVQTASGGVHVYYRKRTADHVGGWLPGQAPEGADVARSDDGWTVAPGTRTPWGSWETFDDPDEDVEVCPEHLWRRLNVRGRPELAQAPSGMVRGLEAVLDRLRAAERHQDADAVELLCTRYGGHDPYIAAGSEEVRVTRPGKRAGDSATVGYVGPGVVKVFSSAWPELAEGARLVVSADGSRLVPVELEELEPFRPELGEDDSLLARLRRDTLSGWDVTELDPPTPVIDGYLHRPGLALVYAPPKAGKTFVTLDMALSMATGAKRWANRRTRRSREFYVAAEGAAGFSQRVAAWRQRHEADEAAFTVLKRPVNLTQPAEVSALCQLLRELECDVLFIDTLARCTPGADENSARDMGLVVQHLDQLRDVGLQGGTVVVVHHTGKDAERGMRGSSALPGALDTAIAVSKTGAQVSVEVEFHKDAEVPDRPAKFTLTPFAGSAVVEYADLHDPASTGADDPLAQVKLEVLRAMNLARHPLSRTEVRDRVRSRGRDVTVALSQMIDAGQVVKADHHLEGRGRHARTELYLPAEELRAGPFRDHPEGVRDTSADPW